MTVERQFRLPFLRSIRFRLLFLLAVMTIISLTAYTFLMLSTNRSLQELAIAASSNTLRQQAQEYLLALNSGIVRENNLVLEKVSQDTLTVAETLAELYRNPDSYLQEQFWPVEQKMQELSKGQFGNPASDVTSVFVPAGVGLSDSVRRDLALSAYLDLILPGVFKNNPNAEAVYFGSSNDVTRYFPNINLGAVLPPDFAITERIWYTGSIEKVQPQGKPWWTPVYEDATGLGWVTTAAMPVFDQQGKIAGVVGFDISLNEMKANIEGLTILGAGYAFLLDESGRAIALPERAYPELLGREANQGETGPDMASVRPEFAGLIGDMKAGKSGFLTITSEDAGEFFVSYAPLEATGWSLATVVPTELVLAEVRQLESQMGSAAVDLGLRRILPVTLAILIVLVILGLAMTNRLVDPIRRLAEAANAIGAGKWDTTLPPAGADEIGVLSSSFGTMRAQLRNLVTDLEKRVNERTEELEKRSKQVQTAAEIARDIASSRDLDGMLNSATVLMVERFGFYHGAIFLIDERREYAHLTSVAGHMSDIMRQRNIKLRVGQQGIVGYVAAQGEAHTSSDVASEKDYYFDPLLAGTRSEIALPLKAGDKVIGVLDLQRTEAGVFAEEEVNVLQTMADQLAIAIENKRLVQHLETAIKESGIQAQKQTLAGWEDSTNRFGTTTYMYDGLGVQPLVKGLPRHLRDDLQAGKTVSAKKVRNEQEISILIVPITLREGTIGLLALEHDDSLHHWTADEINILEATANQAAMTLENARLLEESQWRARREQLIGQTTARIRETLDIETVLKTAAQQVRDALGLPEVVVRLGSPSPKASSDRGN